VGEGYVTMRDCCSQVNGSLPEKIIVFRDGVGDGDMKLVSEFEVPQFFEGFSMFGKMVIFVCSIVLLVPHFVQGQTTSRSFLLWLFRRE